MRDFWMKNRALSLTERGIARCATIRAGTPAWSEAATGIVQPADQVGPAVPGLISGGPSRAQRR